MTGRPENVWERGHWFDEEELIQRVEKSGKFPGGVAVTRPESLAELPESLRNMVSDMIVETMWGKLRGPENLLQAADLLVRRLKRPISLGSVGCGDAAQEKRLVNAGYVNNLFLCEVDDTVEEFYRRADKVPVMGIKGKAPEQVCRDIVRGLGNVDLLYFGDSLHHTHDPYMYLQEAVERVKRWIVISEPFHMDYDQVTPETGYLMDSTPYLESLLSESEHRIWINWAILKGWRVGYIRLITFPESSVMDDELERTFVVLERPQEEELPLYQCPEGSEQGEIFEIWPLSLLDEGERERVRAAIGENGEIPDSLSGFLNLFDLEGYESLNPFNEVLPDIEDKMNDQELSERMARAETVFQIYYILIRDFDIDIFERLYSSSQGSFRPAKLWRFEDGADGFAPFEIKNYLDSKRRVKKVLDPRKHKDVKKARITKLLKDDLMKLRDPSKGGFHMMKAYQRIHGRKPNVAHFSGLTYGKRDFMLPAAFKALGCVNEVIAVDVDYETGEEMDSEINGVRGIKIGAKGLDNDGFMDQFFEAAGNPDVFVLDDGLQHLPDPYKGVDRAYEALTPGGKLYIIAPFRFEEEELILHTHWKHYQTPYPDSMLTLEQQEEWINWLILKGAKVEFTRMRWSSFSTDGLNRVLMVIEKPEEDEYVLTPWVIEQDQELDMQKTANQQDMDYLEMWPYCGLNDQDKEKVREVVGDLNGEALSGVRGELVFRLVYEALDEEEKAEFLEDRDGFLEGFLEGHDQYELLERFEERFGIDEDLRQRFRDNSCIYLTCTILREFYGIDLQDYVERDLQWQEWKYWQFSDNCPDEYEEMYELVGDSEKVMKIFGLK